MVSLSMLASSKKLYAGNPKDKNKTSVACVFAWDVDTGGNSQARGGEMENEKLTHDCTHVGTGGNSQARGGTKKNKKLTHACTHVGTGEKRSRVEKK